MLADGLATAVMAMGKERGLSVVEAYKNTECLLIERTNIPNNPYEIYLSSHFKQYISTTADSFPGLKTP